MYILIIIYITSFRKDITDGDRFYLHQVHQNINLWCWFQSFSTGVSLGFLVTTKLQTTQSHQSEQYIELDKQT